MRAASSRGIDAGAKNPCHSVASYSGRPCSAIVGMSGAPASIPRELAARIAADVQKVLALPETREKLQGAGVSLFTASHEEFKRFFPAEVEKWRGVVKKANLKLE
jgi:tripartite-type tricarboxylate transporter receptor subunit TctC